MSDSIDKATTTELRAIARQKTMAFTKATEDSPTIADVVSRAARDIDNLTFALSQATKRAERAEWFIVHMADWNKRQEREYFATIEEVFKSPSPGAGA